MIYQLFLKGGPIMWPILLLSVVTVAVLFERLLFLMTETRRRDIPLLRKIFELVEHGHLAQALAIAEKSKDPVIRVLAEGMRHKDGSVSDALLEAANSQLDRYNKGLVVLDTAVTLGPLLGLLGTVTGMMRAFSIVGGGELAGKQAAITGGVAESLIAVSFGLGVAIVAIVPLNFFSARMEAMRREMEAASTKLEMLLLRFQRRPSGETEYLEGEIPAHRQGR
ncbi:Biopolymer transporter [Methylacidimicrobium sp. AP8]|uniref:MotA/TolQ/ExbB proton channel family protein n=1 Tax=Methylacidimicrobium sp. AP8 TaxID=2730359 RepID=UPI0018C0E733|nr:MotA/TolQ/ExbB proton channel family protein [Methylacidimicrobium sp. AP8]CAB4242523.1 Biopolymer transporter [Methylacidimicrobium sp. AP8]